MKAWVLVRHGRARDAFQLRDMPDPVPTPAQVLVKVEGFGLNFADVMAAKGLYREAPPLPALLGYEVVGRVVASGSPEHAHWIGKRVLALTRFGGYGELAATDHRAVAEIPETMPLGEAAALGTQGCTAWYMAHYACPLWQGQRVLIHSAAGGVGQLLVMLAVQRGCTVFAVAGGEAKMERLRQLGVHHPIDRHRAPYQEQVRRILGSERLDSSFNAVAGATFRHDMKLIGSGGTVVLYGGATRSDGSGLFPTLRFVMSMGLLIPITLMMRSKSIVGVNMLKLGDHRPALMAQCLREIVGHATRSQWRPHVHAELAADQLPLAHELLGAGSTMGKVAIRW